MSAQSTLDKIRIADAILRLVVDAGDLTHGQKNGAIKIARDALAEAMEDAETLAWRERDAAAPRRPRTVTPPTDPTDPGEEAPHDSQEIPF